MATSDVQLINEVRSFTGYTDHNTFDDAEVQEIVNIAKQEVRQHLGRPNYEFYRTSPINTFDADRALFWFTCIGLKVRAGEIGAANLSLSELEKTKTEGQYDFWFDNLWRCVHSATPEEFRGASSTQITRGDERNYEYQQPDYGGE
jgi:hypothetical protein